MKRTAHSIARTGIARVRHEHLVAANQARGRFARLPRAVRAAARVAAPYVLATVLGLAWGALPVLLDDPRAVPSAAHR